MKYLKYTQVDHLTRKPVTEEPATNGPDFPSVAGLVFDFALESQYPTMTPTFYGTCDDTSSTDIPGVLAVLTIDQYTADKNAEMATRLLNARNAKYDQLTTLRQNKEAAGIVVHQLNGTILPGPITILTAKDDQDRIDSCLNNMARYKLDSIDFKTADNVWMAMTYDQIFAVGQLVVNYVQGCFTTEMFHSVQIAGFTDVDSINAYDITTNWPDNT